MEEVQPRRKGGYKEGGADDRAVAPEQRVERRRAPSSCSYSWSVNVYQLTHEKDISSIVRSPLTAHWSGAGL